MAIRDATRTSRGIASVSRSISSQTLHSTVSGAPTHAVPSFIPAAPISMFSIAALTSIIQVVDELGVAQTATTAEAVSR